MNEQEFASNTVDKEALKNTVDENRADLGILLVHGIGQSSSGETLVRFGEPLIKWLDDWVGLENHTKVEVIDAVLGVEANDPAVPATARLKITAPAADESGRRTIEWLIAESWWAESFVPPSFFELTEWGFKAMPWTIFFHFYRRFNRATESLSAAFYAQPVSVKNIVICGRKFCFECMLLLAALLLSPILLITLSIILILGTIPIPKVRTFVGWLQLSLSLTVGDSFSLLGTRIGAEAIYNRVGRDFDWLTKRSKKVAVIAHSQGAAVAYRVVSRDNSKRCKLLITFGSGIRKLAQIRLLKHQPVEWIWSASQALIPFIFVAYISRTTLGLWQGLILSLLVPAIWLLASLMLGLLSRWVNPISRFLKHVTLKKKSNQRHVFMVQAIGFALIATTVVTITLLAPTKDRTTTTVVTLLVSFSWALLYGAWMLASDKVRDIAVMNIHQNKRASPASEQPLSASVRWLDLYANSDPVPNGPIFDNQQMDQLTFRSKMGGVETRQVFNYSSWLSDHNSYWKNEAGFVAIVVGALGDVCNLKLEEIFPLDRERLIIACHRRCQRIRWLCYARITVLASMIAGWLANGMDDYATNLLGSATHYLRNLPLLGFLLSPILPKTVQPSMETTLITLLLGGIASYGLISFCWAIWNKKDRELSIERRWDNIQANDLLPATLFHCAWLLPIVTAIILCFGWIHGPMWAYVLVHLIIVTLATYITKFDSFRGRVQSVWPLLLKRHDLWTSATKELWTQTLRTGQTAYIVPFIPNDGDIKWRAGITLVFRGSNPWYATTWHDETKTSTLSEAIDWSRSQVDQVYVSTDNLKYHSVEQLMERWYEPATAINFWSRFLKNYAISDSQRIEALRHRAQRFLQQKLFYDAKADYHAILEIPDLSNEERTTALNKHASCNQQQGDIKGAVVDYTAVIDTNEAPVLQLSIARIGRGDCYTQEGHFELAISDYTAVIQTPQISQDLLAIAYAGRGWTAYRKGHHENFYNDIVLANKIAPENLRIRFNLSLATLLTKRHKQAVEIYRSNIKTCSSLELILEAIQDLEQVLVEQEMPSFYAMSILKSLKDRYTEILHRVESE